MNFISARFIGLLKVGLKRLLLVLLLVFTTTGSAHSGRTDSKGGHWNSKTGSYHYHSKKASDNSYLAYFIGLTLVSGFALFIYMAITDRNKKLKK